MSEHFAIQGFITLVPVTFCAQSEAKKGKIKLSILLFLFPPQKKNQTHSLTQGHMTTTTQLYNQSKSTKGHCQNVSFIYTKVCFLCNCCIWVVTHTNPIQTREPFRFNKGCTLVFSKLPEDTLCQVKPVKVEITL